MRHDKFRTFHHERMAPLSLQSPDMLSRARILVIRGLTIEIKLRIQILSNMIAVFSHKQYVAILSGFQRLVKKSC